MSKLIEFYTAVLSACNIVSDDNGLLSFQFGDRKHPAMAKGKRMALPTAANLRTSGAEYAIVHPLMESAAGTETAVMERIRTVIGQSLHVRLTTLMGELLNLATNVGEHSKTNSEQTDLLVLLKDVDKETAAKWLQLCAQASKDDTYSAVHIFVKKQARVGDRTYARGAIVTWPLYEALKKMVANNEKKLGTVPLRLKDKDALIKLMQYVVDGIDAPGKYNVGSASDVGPSFDCLMRAVAGVADEINAVAQTFERFVANVDVVKMDTGWIEQLKDLHSMLTEIRSIPMQDNGQAKAVAAAPAVMPVIYPEVRQSTLSVAPALPVVAPAPVMQVQTVTTMSAPAPAVATPGTPVQYRPSSMQPAMQPGYMNVQNQQQVCLDQYGRQCTLVNGQLIPIQGGGMGIVQQPPVRQQLNPMTARMLDNAGAFTQAPPAPQMPQTQTAPAASGVVYDAQGRAMVPLASGGYAYLQTGAQPVQQAAPVIHPSTVNAADWRTAAPIQQRAFSGNAGGNQQGFGGY
jgi:hypothetical protein